jgi:feruloyl esterase
MEAQRYPADYDGILSGCPAINWSQLHGGQMWGHLAMLEAKNFVAQCKFEAARVASIEACDEMDGVVDGVIEDPRQCSYDPEPLVGSPIDDCDPITKADADVIRKIWQGPHRQDGAFLWYGLPHGASFSGLHNTGGDPLGGLPSRITLDWIRYFLTQDPEWDWTTLEPGSYEQLWDQGVEQYTAVLGTADPDLSGFRDQGGKAIMWHGWADQLIYPQGSIDYYTRVRERLGGAEKTDGFLRFFLAPGVAHCRGGDGPQPNGHFEALRKWVEEGIPPETLDGVLSDDSGDVIRTRPLCQFPLVAHYTGRGSTDDASNFECVEGF